MDASDFDTLVSLGVDAFDTAVVSIGGDLAQAVLVTLTLKELGINRVVCEAQSDRDRRVLLRIGADEVVMPAIESAKAVAYNLTGRTTGTAESPRRWCAPEPPPPAVSSIPDSPPDRACV